MVDPPSPGSDPRRILPLARRDRAAAVAALSELSVEEQVALVCDAPLAQRAELLGLLPDPESVVPAIPEAEFCFTVKAIGLSDAVWLLELAEPQQLVAAIDLDAWNGIALDPEALDAWVDALAQTDRDSLLRAVRALDPELLVRFLESRIRVELKPEDPGWQPPEGAQTLDGQFYFGAVSEDDDLSGVVHLLRTLFEADYWTYFRLLQGTLWELPSETEEWALRWRTGRLEDLGFPPWERSMRIYGYLRPEERAALPPHLRPLDVAAWNLPVWIPRLPASPDSRHALFRAIARLGEDERSACYYAFIGVVNKLAVADRLPLSDAASTPIAIEKAADLVSDGLRFVAEANQIDEVEALRRVPMERLFRVGANLNPERAKPPASRGAASEDGSEDENATG